MNIYCCLTKTRIKALKRPLMYFSGGCVGVFLVINAYWFINHLVHDSFPESGFLGLELNFAFSVIFTLLTLAVLVTLIATTIYSLSVKYWKGMPE